MVKAVYLFMMLAPLVLSGADGILKEIFHKPIPNNATNIDDPYCRQCHPVSFEDNHTANPVSINIYTHGNIVTTTTVDPYSLACLTCHNGNDAQNAPVKLPVCNCDSAEQKAISSTIKSHPVFNAYPNGKKEFRFSGDPLPGVWNDAQTVNDLLREGKVVCISCHIPHFKETGYLRAPMKGSMLCFGCHKK